jgi:putative membrane protein
MAKTVVFLVLIALVVVFVIQNTQVVEFQFLAWKVSMSRALLLLGTFGMGIVVGWLARRVRHRGQQAG